MARFTPQQRKIIVDEFAASGLSQKDFAEQRGLGLSTIHRWVRKHRRKPGSAGTTVRFIELNSPAPMPTSSIRLYIGPSVRLELGELPPVDYLAALAGSCRAC